MHKIPLYTFFKIIILFVLLLLPELCISQDSTALKSHKDTTAYSPEILLSHSKYYYLNPVRPDTITRKRFLWLPLKLFDDIFNYLPGFYLNYMDVGQPNQLNYEQLDHHYTGLLRNGIPLNDLFDGSVDLNLLSRNEIAEVETTNGYGNSLYNYDNYINIIQRQVYQYRPYSEISFWQDRFNNLYFDGTYHQNLFRNFNFNFGITKHSYDGIFTNSDFDKWQGRFNASYFGNKHLNFSLSANYAHIQRGLNEGIDPYTTVFDRENMLGSGVANVRKIGVRDDRERFNVIFDGLFAYGKDTNSFTDLKLYTDNSFRRYQNIDTISMLKENTHWITYGIKLRQYASFNLAKNVTFASNTEFEYDKDYIFSPLYDLRNSSRTYLFEGVDITASPLGINAYAKAYKLDYFENKYFYDYGLEPSVDLKINPDVQLNAYAGFTSSQKLPDYQQEFIRRKYSAENTYPTTRFEDLTHARLGGFIQYKDNEFSIEYYRNTVKDAIALSVDSGVFRIDNGNKYTYYGMNTNLNLSIYHFELGANVSYNTNPSRTIMSSPDWSGNLSLAYHNILIHNKFELKVGINSRFWDKYYAVFYDGRYNDFTNRLFDTTFDKYSFYLIKSNATLDFFVIGKIDKAVFGLTLENILNRIIYTTGVYPYQGRGGLGNVISRFNVTWYFLN